MCNLFDLFIVFSGHYGDVQRVKILYNKKDTALIQFADASQASTGKQSPALSFKATKWNALF